MTRDDVLEKVKEILVTDFHVPAAKIKEDATFRGTLGMDSLDAVDLIFLLKKTFNLSSDAHAFRELHSVRNVVDHILAASQAAP